MKFSILLYVLYIVLKIASYTNKSFKKYIKSACAKVLIKTADGERARLFFFNKGKLSSVAGDQKDFDVAMIWENANTGFSVMTSKKKDASFNAAAEGRLQVKGMSVYAQWFEDGIKLVL